MHRGKRTTTTKDHPPKDEAPVSQNKAGTKGKGKQKQADDKAAKANAQVDAEDDSAMIAKLADVVMKDGALNELIDKYTASLVNDQSAGANQLPADEK